MSGLFFINIFYLFFIYKKLIILKENIRIKKRIKGN